VKSLLIALALATVTFAQTPGPNPALLNPASLVEQAPPIFDVTFTTTKGDFVVEVTRSWAPKGADRFYNLVKNGFFTDASFFRIVPNFIVQFGMAADPRVTQAWRTAVIPDDPLGHSNTEGTVVFAKTTAPNSRTTQLFINLADNTHQLDPPYQQGFSPFGEVISGMSVVNSLYSGYGEGSDMGGRGPTQGRITAEGKPYLDKNFPMLDSVKSATIQGASTSPGEAPAPTPTLKLGMTIDEVVAVMGQPDRAADLGAKKIYSYKDMKITFVDGKVTDIE
jgi:peptidyl-prolyl cis-trans isomerase A (cyclophilin A)